MKYRLLASLLVLGILGALAYFFASPNSDETSSAPAPSQPEDPGFK